MSDEPEEPIYDDSVTIYHGMEDFRDFDWFGHPRAKIREPVTPWTPDPSVAPPWNWVPERPYAYRSGEHGPVYRETLEKLRSFLDWKPSKKTAKRKRSGDQVAGPEHKIKKSDTSESGWMIYTARIKLGLTKQAVVEHVGKATAHTLRRIEIGKVVVLPKDIPAYAEILELDPEELEAAAMRDRVRLNKFMGRPGEVRGLVPRSFQPREGYVSWRWMYDYLVEDMMFDPEKVKKVLGATVEFDPADAQKYVQKLLK